MGTSNWQNIPFCIEALMKISPSKVLDVGVGFGRWGILIREFCEEWFGRVHPRDWTIRVEGIEAYVPNLAPYHHAFYDHIHVGDARVVLPRVLPQGWDVTIFGDVLEHFTKPEAKKLLEQALQHSTYVLVNIPLGSSWPQGEKYDNPYERHLSEWEPEDFQGPNLVRAERFVDFMDRPFGSFILSRTDPKDLAVALFSRSTHVDRLAELEGQAARFGLEEQIRSLQEARRAVAELEEIRASRAWRLVRGLWASPTYRKLRSLWPRPADVSQGQLGPGVAAPAQDGARSDGQKPVADGHVAYEHGPASAAHRLLSPSPQRSFSEEERAWLESVHRSQPQAIAVIHPEWLGIRSSTSQRFDHILPVPGDLDPAEALHYARLLAESDCPRIVFSGFPLDHGHVARALHRLRKDIKIFAIWHGNLLQHREPYAWQCFLALMDLARSGVLYKVGFVKAGMAEFVGHRFGIRTGFVMNFVKSVPSHPSKPLAGGPHLGIWLPGADNWRKPPFAMLAAAAEIPGAVVHASSVTDVARTFGRLLDVKMDLSEAVIPQEQMPKCLAQMHLNLYVTLTECAPMVVLESLAVGAPCLTGPTSHFFEDDPYLYDRLVVPSPDRHDVIAAYIERALDERDQIIDRYRQYAVEYNRRAEESISGFLELGD